MEEKNKSAVLTETTVKMTLHEGRGMRRIQTIAREINEKRKKTEKPRNVVSP